MTKRLFIATAVMAIALCATAQTVTLNPIVVTGEGHHTRQKEAVTPVRVITADDIRDKGITTFEAAIERILPQVSFAPNSMGSQLRLNGLSNKYVLILVNGRKLSGDISNNIDLSRIPMSRIKRIEVLDGAASALYGSDAIAGVINIITERPSDELFSATSDTYLSGEGKFTQSVNVDVNAGGFSSQTTFTHEEANSYRNNDYELVDEETGETERNISPLYNGYHSNLLAERITYTNRGLTVNAGIEGYYKMTDRPDTNDEVDGGTSYEMRYKGLRWNIGGLYKFTSKNSLQVDFTVDRFRYGKEYDVATSSYEVGYYTNSKKEKTLDADAKAVLGLVRGGTTVVGANWKKDYLVSSSGDIDANAYTLAGYVQHDQTIVHGLKATVGVRFTHHETAGNHLTPKVGVMYSPGRFIFRANYSMGFRSPGLDELYYEYCSINRGKAQVSFGNTDLKPEKSQYISIGAEYNSERFSLAVSGYMNFIDDMIIKDNIAVDDDVRAMLMETFEDLTEDYAAAMTTYARYVNADKGEVKGLQANARVTIIEGLDINAAYAYTYARERSSGVWGTLDRSIKNTVTMGANYRHAWGTYTLNANISGRMQSKTYYDSYENAPGYGVWNINTTHSFTGFAHLLIEPSIGIDNIFDRVDDRIDTSLRKYALYSPGRMLTIGLKVKFL